MARLHMLMCGKEWYKGLYQLHHAMLLTTTETLFELVYALLDMNDEDGICVIGSQPQLNSRNELENKYSK